MASALDIVNSGLIQAGEAELSALGDGTTVSDKADALYTAVRDDMLRSHTWNFATKRLKLAPSATEPVSEFDYQFRLPSDFVRIVEVSDSSAGGGIRYNIEVGEEDTVEGTFEESNSGTLTVGDGVTNGKNFAIKFTNTAAGTVTKMQLDVANVNTAFSCLAKIYSNNSGSPGTQVGSSSTATTLAQGVNNFTWSSGNPVLDAETVYWAVFTDNTAATGDVDLRASASSSDFGSGLHDTITSITDSLSTEYRVGIHVSQGAQAMFILANSTEVYLRYVAAITDTTLYPADFREALSKRLAAEFSLAIANSRSQYESLMEAHRSVLRRARSVDGMEDYPPQFPDGSWVTDRFRTNWVR